jgi:hypothetical protein
MKLVVLVVSIVGSSLILLRGNPVDLQLCEAVDTSCTLFYSNVWKISIFFPFVLFFSIITYRLPVRVFNYWYTFLLGWGSLTLLVTTVVYVGYFGFNNDVFTLGIGRLLTYTMYTIFVIGSIVSIVRGYNSNRS